MKKEVLKFLILLMVAVGAGPAAGALWQWSLTPSTNGSADPSINYSEGQAPSSLNDSARAMMSRLAEWRQDISGADVLTGTSTAYVLTTVASSNGGLGLCSGATSLTDGQMIAFRVNVTNGASAQITVDSCSSLPLQSTAGTALPAGSVVGGSPYRASYNLSSNAWVMEAIYGNTFGIPLGGLMPFTLGVVPSGNFVFPAGQCLSTTTYSVYWVALGSPASGGCPGGQFAVLDMRGKVPAALDNLNGTPANILTSASTGCGTAMTSVGVTCGNGMESYSILQGNFPNVNFTVSGITLSNGSLGFNGGTESACNNLGGTHCAGGAQDTFMVTTGGSTTDFSTRSNVSVATQGTAASGGSGTAMPKVQPTIGVTYLLRVL